MRPMTLGEIISTLEQKDPALQVSFDFVHFTPTALASYRGYYEQLALGYGTDGLPTVAKVLQELRSAIGKTFCGWKGGDYVMDENTPVWVANPGECAGTAIVDITDDYYIRIRTAFIE